MFPYRYYIKKKLKDTKFQTKCDLTAFYAKTVSASHAGYDEVYTSWKFT